MSIGETPAFDSSEPRRFNALSFTIPKALSLKKSVAFETILDAIESSFSAAEALVMVAAPTDTMVMAERIPAMILVLKRFLVLVFFIVISPLSFDFVFMMFVLLLVLNKYFIAFSPFGFVPLTVISLYQGTCDKPLTKIRIFQKITKARQKAGCNKTVYVVFRLYYPLIGLFISYGTSIRAT